MDTWKAVKTKLETIVALFTIISYLYYGLPNTIDLFEKWSKRIAERNQHHYEVIKEDISWSDAKERCEKQGGHLATVTTEEELATIIELANDERIHFAWLGATSENGAWEWVTGEPFEESTYKSWWYKGEPTGKDKDGTLEYYLIMWKDGEWSWNDEANNPSKALKHMRGDMGFVCEFNDE